MGDRKTVKEPYELITGYLGILRGAPIELVNEAYYQILKQIKNHPIRENMILGYKMIAILGSVFAPSSTLCFCILKYLTNIISETTDNELSKICNYAIPRICNSFENKRYSIMSEEEFDAIENLTVMFVRIHFFSGTSTRISYENYSSVRDVKASLMQKLEMEMSKLNYYGIYEVFERETYTEERFLNENDRFADVVDECCIESKRASEKGEDTNFCFYLKIQLYFPYSHDDIDSVTMLYVQAVYDILKGKYPLSESQLFELAAYKLVVDFGCANTDSLRFLTNNTFRYLPADLNKKNTTAFNVSKVTAEYEKLDGISKTEGKIEFLKRIEDCHVFQSHQFSCQFRADLNKNNSDKLPLEMHLLIKNTEILLCDSKLNELVSIKFEDIVTWGISNKLIVLCIPTGEEKYKKYYLSTTQVEEIYYLIECFTNNLIGNNLEETISKTGEKLQRIKTTDIPIKGQQSKLKRVATKFTK